MTSAAPTILDRIVAHKRTELAALSGTMPDTEARAEDQIATRRDFEVRSWLLAQPSSRS